MNPFSTYMTLPWECFRVGYNFLTWYDANYQPTPDLADPVPTVANGGITDGGRVWTFHLRPNVKWSDGVPLTAADVAYTYNRILRQKLGMYIGYFTNVTKVQATDPHTVVITCSKPNGVLTALYVPILPEHIWSKVPDSKVATWSNVPMVSSGPFQVAEVQNGKFVKLTRNPYYKDGFGVEPTVDVILFDMYQEQDSLVDDYKMGNLDAAIELDPGFYRPLKNVPGSTLVAAPALGFHELGMNCYKSPKSKGNRLLLDVRIRQAIDYAIDKQQIANVAMDGLAPVASSLLSPVQEYYRWQVPADQQYTYDPAKAKAILYAAGYKMGPGGIRVAPNGKPLKFRLAAMTDYPMDVTAAKLISGYLKRVGIGTTLQVMDEGAFTNDNYSNANDDLYIWNWNADIDPGYILSTFTTGQLLNGSDSEYSNPQYDALYVKQSEAMDPAERKTDHRSDAGDPLQGLAVRDPLVQHEHPGLPHRQVDRLQLGAAGRPRRGVSQHAAHDLHRPQAQDGVHDAGRRRQHRPDHRRRGGRGHRAGDRHGRAPAAAAAGRRGRLIGSRLSGSRLSGSRPTGAQRRVGRTPALRRASS